MEFNRKNKEIEVKKFFGLIIAIMFFAQTGVYAATDWTNNTGVQKVNTIGKNLLAKNGLPTKITFKVIETDEINAYANVDKEICVYTGLLKFVETDAELAGVIAHEIGHIINSHVTKQNVINTVTTNAIYNVNLDSKLKTGAAVANDLSMKKMSRTAEYEADITGVDLITKAGYSPLAMVSVLYKISGNYIDFNSDHPSGDKRTMYIYDYITYTYPTQAKSGYTTGSYKSFMEYASPIVKTRTENPKKLASFNKTQAKLKEKRAKKLAKYKTASQLSGWDKSFNVIKALTN